MRLLKFILPVSMLLFLGLLTVVIAVVFSNRRAIQLPVADAAAAPEGTVKNLIEVPVSWNDNRPGASAELARRCAAFRKTVSDASLKFSGSPESARADESVDLTLTLRMDSRVQFGILADELLAGQRTGFWRHQLECRKDLSDSGGQYLIVRLPTAEDAERYEEDDGTVVRVWLEADNSAAAYRVSARRGDDRIERVSFSNVYRLEEFLRAQANRTDLVIDAAADVNLQAFVDVYNAAVKARFRHVWISRPRK